MVDLGLRSPTSAKVKEFDCNLTREMVDLIDREAWPEGLDGGVIKESI